jgi:hypothetical protein
MALSIETMRKRPPSIPIDISMQKHTYGYGITLPFRQSRKIRQQSEPAIEIALATPPHLLGKFSTSEKHF